MQDFEKAGVFYLGKQDWPGGRKPGIRGSPVRENAVEY